MKPHPAVTAALSAMTFSERSINKLFRACIDAASSEAPGGLRNRLWQNDAVVSAIESLQDAIEMERDAGPAQSRLLAAIDFELRQPV